MAEVTLKSFLDNDSAVKAARKKLTAASAELNKQKAALAAAGGRISATQREVIDKRIAEAQAAYDSARSNASSVEASRTSYFQANEKTIRASAQSKEVSQAKQELQDVLSLMQTQPNSPILQARAADLRDRINGTGKYAPKPKVEVKDKTPGESETTAAARDYISEVNNAAKIVRAMSAKERQDLASLLKSSKFYDGPITGVYSDALVKAYQTAIGANQARSLAWGEEVSWTQFLQDKLNEAAATATTGGLAKPSGTVSISTPLEAAAKVEAIFKSELGRLPTPEERDKYSKELIDEEKKTSSITKATQKKIGGVTVTEYTGGLDRDQFLQDKIRKLPEYSNTKAAKRTLTVQDLAKTAMANGLNLDKNFGADVVAGWVKRVENGEDVDTFKNLIRKTAAIGLPDNAAALIEQGLDLDSVYAPYKKSMATILELPENSISLNDPTLRGAITADKAMTVFDFEKQLRRDARWQYTDKAKEEVSSAALRVLRDFGFQG